jgi:hypothetical protein
LEGGGRENEKRKEQKRKEFFFFFFFFFGGKKKAKDTVCQGETDKMKQKRKEFEIPLYSLQISNSHKHI